MYIHTYTYIYIQYIYSSPYRSPPFSLPYFVYNMVAEISFSRIPFLSLVLVSMWMSATMPYSLNTNFLQVWKLFLSSPPLLLPFASPPPPLLLLPSSSFSSITRGVCFRWACRWPRG